MGVSFAHEIFTVVPDACFKIERTWSIINWCTFNPDGLCIDVPNPNPVLLPANGSANNTGPTVSDVDPDDPANANNPWKATKVKVTPDAATATNYATQVYVKDVNCYTYKQIIKIDDNQPPVAECPATPVTICAGPTTTS